MSDPVPQPSRAEHAQIFNEFQSQWRTRMEATLKLVMIIAGGMLTLSVGAVLGNSSSKIPFYLVGNLAWSWGLLFYSIAAGTLVMVGMVAASFHMGVRMRKQIQSGGPQGTVFVRTWQWLRALNAAMGVSALLSFLAGLVLISQVAIGVAHAAATKPSAISAIVSVPSEQSPLAPPVTAPARQSAVEVTSEQDRAAKAALDKKLVDFNGDLAHYTKYLVGLGALQIGGIIAQLILLFFAFRESRRASDIAHDAMVASQRAFVFVIGAVGRWELDAASQKYNWRLVAHLSNTGNTATKNMRMHSNCVLMSSPLPKGFNFDYITANTGTGLIGPKLTAYGGQVPPMPNPALTPQDLLDAQQGRKWLYIMGWVRYFDIFPGTPERITRYCFLVTPSGDPFSFSPAHPDGMVFPTFHHFENNCADDGCRPIGA